MNRVQFTGNEQLCRRLHELLNDPVMQYAMAIALNACKPTEPRPGMGDLIQQAAMSGQRSKGANDLVAELQSLTIPGKQQVPSEQPYDHAAKEALIAQGLTPEQAEQAAKESYTQT